MLVKKGYKVKEGLVIGHEKVIFFNFGKSAKVN